MKNPPHYLMRPLSVFEGKVRIGAQNAVLDALARSSSVTQAARRLGLNRTYLSRLITELDLRRAAPKRLKKSTTYRRAIIEETRSTIRQALCDANGNRVLTARRLGLSRSHLLRYIKRFGLAREFPGKWGSPGRIPKGLT